MRALLHAFSVVLLLPGLVFAAGALALGHAIGDGRAGGMLMRLLEMALAILDWGAFAAIAALILLVVAGFDAGIRWIAATIVAALALASAIVWTALAGAPTPEEIPFMLPGALAFGISAWIAWTERPGARRPEPVSR